MEVRSDPKVPASLLQLAHWTPMPSGGGRCWEGDTELASEAELVLGPQPQVTCEAHTRPGLSLQQELWSQVGYAPESVPDAQHPGVERTLPESWSLFQIPCTASCRDSLEAEK